MVNCACYLSVNVSVLLKGLVNSVPHYLYINLFIWNTCRHNLGAVFLSQIVMCIKYYIVISF